MLLEIYSNIVALSDKSAALSAHTKHRRFYGLLRIQYLTGVKDIHSYESHRIQIGLPAHVGQKCHHCFCYYYYLLCKMAAVHTYTEMQKTIKTHKTHDVKRPKNTIKNTFCTLLI